MALPGDTPDPHLLPLCTQDTKLDEPEPNEPSGTDPYTRYPCTHVHTHMHTRTPKAHICTCTRLCAHAPHTLEGTRPTRTSTHSNTHITGT